MDCPTCIDRRALDGDCFSPSGGSGGRYRYALWYGISGGAFKVTWVMLNPSYANATMSVIDNTVNRCRNYAIAWGASRVEVVNVFALVETNAAKMVAHPAPVEHERGVNDEHIRRACDEADLIVVAWGANVQAPALRERMVTVRAVLSPYKLHALAVTKDGEPGHPLYLKKTLEPVPFRFR